MLKLTLTLAQATGTFPGGGGGATPNAIASLVSCFFWLAVIVLVIAGLWKTFDKAGQPGWAAIVPIYNLYVLCQIAGRPWWWLILMLIPIVSLIVAIVLAIDVAKSFGKGIGFGIGLALLAPIFYCILGFGSAQYVGPAAAGKAFL